MAWSIIEAPQTGLQGQRDGKQLTTRTFTRRFTLTSDTATTSTDARLALAVQGVDGTGERIAEGAISVGNGLYICDSIDIEQQSVMFFNASAVYKTPKIDPNNSEEPEDPVVARPTRVSYSTVSSDESTDTDFEDNPLKTLTGEIIQGQTRTVSDLKATITKLYDVFTPSSFYEYIDAVNTDTFLGFPPGTAKVQAITANEITEQNRPYWEVTVEVLFRKPYRVDADKAWWLRILHEGYYCFTLESLDKPVRIMDANNEPVTQPQLLSEVGFALQEGEDPYWLTFQIYETKAFSGMNLGV